MRLNNLGIIIITILLIGSVPILQMIFYSEDIIDKPTTNQITFATYNLHYGVTSEGVYDLNGLKSIFKSEKPTIIGFQEITFNAPYNGYPAMYVELELLMKNLGYKYSYYSSDYGYNLGNAIFSMYEIISTKTIEYDAQQIFHRNFLDVIIDVEGTLVHVFNTHLTHRPGGGKSGEVRLAQIEQLLNYIDELDISDENIVMLGDFNITPKYKGSINPEYILLTANYTDAWTITNPNLEGYTAPAIEPTVRIDYIFVNSLITINSCDTVDTLQSDHFPVFCRLTLN